MFLRGRDGTVEADRARRCQEEIWGRPQEPKSDGWTIGWEDSIQMVKSYPNQRWPDHRTSSNKRKHQATGQTQDPSWKQSSIQDLKADTKDEQQASKHYHQLAKEAPTKQDQNTLNAMARDEARHKRNLVKMQWVSLIRIWRPLLVLPALTNLTQSSFF